MAIKRNYFFEELTEEDPTPLSNDPNLNDYDKTDSYSQYLDYDDVAGTVDIELGGGKDEELDGDGTPSLEQSILEDVIFDEAYTAYLTEAKIESKEDLERELAKLDGKPNAAIKAVGIAAAILTFAAGTGIAMAVAGKIAAPIDKTAAPTPVKFASGVFIGMGVGGLVSRAILPIVNFINKQTCDKGQKVNAAKKLIKEIDKAIVKAEKAKSKKDADTKAIDKLIKELKSGKTEAEKALDKFEKLPDDYKYKKESYSYTDFYYMEENNIMDGIFLDAMQESYMDDMRIMEAIAANNSILHTLSEAGINEEAQEQVKEGQKQNIFQKIIAAIKKFFSMIGSVIGRIVQWFKDKFNKDEKLVEELNKAASSSDTIEATEAEDKYPEAYRKAIEQIEDKALIPIVNMMQDAVGNRDYSKCKTAADTLNKLEDDFYNLCKAGGYKGTKEDCIKSFLSNSAEQSLTNAQRNLLSVADSGKRNFGKKLAAKNKQNAADDDAGEITGMSTPGGTSKVDTSNIKGYGSNTVRVSKLNSFNNSALFFTEADDATKEKKGINIKRKLAEFKEWKKEHKLFAKIKQRIDASLNQTQNKLKSHYSGMESEELTTANYIFTTFKNVIMTLLSSCASGIQSGYNKFMGLIKRIGGKLIKPKSEMFINISEAALGEMVYAHYTAMVEADVTFGDGVDVTDVMDSTIGDGETITKEKTVCVNNESYRVKVSATKI